MPHRVQQIQLTLIHAFEFFGLAVATAIASINSLIDEESWDRLTGRHGALFFMAIALIIFWNSGRLREKREAARLIANEAKEDARRREEERLRQTENEAREQRHREAMQLQERNSNKLFEINAENIKANFIISKALSDLKEQIASRPCQKL